MEESCARNGGAGCAGFRKDCWKTDQVMPDGEDILTTDLTHPLRRSTGLTEGFTEWATKRKPNLRRIAMARPDPKRFQGIIFKETGLRPEGNVFHLVTGIRYTLTVRDYGWQQIVMKWHSRWVCPKHCAVLEYEIDPVLTPDQMVVGDCQEGDRPYLKQENQFEPTSSGCSVIAVIGGGVGMCQSGGAVRYASSGLYFEPQKEIEWRLSFRIPRSGSAGNQRVFMSL